MEYPHLGKYCSEETCKRLDFLPVKCDACERIFCSNHMSYTKHNCPSAYKKNIQVPICPLCNKPVPIKRGDLPDDAVGSHIDNECRSDQAQERKQVFTNKCSLKNCKTKEMVPVICGDCRLNFCFKHRHNIDHNCGGLKKRTANAALMRQKQNGISLNRNQASHVKSVQGSLSEDEALARALQISIEDNVSQKRNTRNQQQSCLVS
ncbi:hypothetical protein PGB90_000491 [Kerria lacca]